MFYPIFDGFYPFWGVNIDFTKNSKSESCLDFFGGHFKLLHMKIGWQIKNFSFFYHRPTPRPLLCVTNVSYAYNLHVSCVSNALSVTQRALKMFWLSSATQQMVICNSLALNKSKFLCFGCWRRISPELPLSGDLGVGLAKMAITPRKIIQNFCKVYQNVCHNIWEILVTCHAYWTLMGDTGRDWLSQNRPWWKQI